MRIPLSIYAVLLAVIFPCAGLFAQQTNLSEILKKHEAELNITSAEISDMIISDQYFAKELNAQLIYVQQTYLGVPVYNNISTVVLPTAGKAFVTNKRFSKMENLTSSKSANPATTASAALQSVLGELNLRGTDYPAIVSSSNNGRNLIFSKSSVSKEDIRAQLMWVGNDKGDLFTLCWQIEIAPLLSKDYWLMSVDANTGAVIRKDNYTVYCTIDNSLNTEANCAELGHLHKMPAAPPSANKTSESNVTAGYFVSPFPSMSPTHPGGALSIVNNPWNAVSVSGNSDAITLKWHNDGITDYNYTRGNNVYAQENRDNNEGTMGLSAVSTTTFPNLSFSYGYNNQNPPINTPNQNTAITNLFYWNNIIHNLSYLYGFTEPAGNFQANNLGRGGFGNDYVIAHAQDAGGVNNAMFSSPPDGTKPSMYMFLWNTAPSLLFVNAPSSYVGYKTAVEGAFSVNNILMTKGAITAEIVLLNDDVSGATHLGCSVAYNAAAFNGKIVLIDRGTCSFTEKVKLAQNAGAVAVLIADNTSATPIVMGGNDNTITIPALMITMAEGNNMKTRLATQSIVATLSDVKVDGDLDNGVILHEYTHGISNRLTGGPSAGGCLQNAEQMGEGWSDYFSLMLSKDWSTATVNDGGVPIGIGTFVRNQAYTGNGIRNYRYSTNMAVNPWKYGHVATNTGGGAHAIGEIWCTMLWEMTWSIIQQQNIINPNLYNTSAAGGNSVALKLVTAGMKLQPCSPGFVDGRDAILKADTLLYNGANSCAIWAAFAKRGVGVGASQGSSNSYVDQTESFVVPSAAAGQMNTDKTEVAMNDEIEYTIRLSSQCAPISNYKLVDTLPANLTYVKFSGGTYDATNRTVTFNNISLPPSSTANFSFRATVNPGTYSAPVVHINEKVNAPGLPAGWTTIGSSNGGWTTSGVRFKSSSYALYAAEPSSPNKLVLTSTNAYPLDRVSMLSFWHWFNTETGYDGGVLEYSLNNGVSWIDAGPLMKKNGYNSVISAASGTPLAGRNSFSGASGDFIETIVDFSSLAGSNVLLRFTFSCDNGGAGNGWFVDDIYLSSKSGIVNAAQLFNNFNQHIATLDTVTYISNALPVNWASFDLIKQSSAVLLKWSTLTEVNTQSFIVEKSADGKDFEQIYSVAAAGNSNALHNYRFTDNNPLKGSNYYRIKQIDKDGAFSYSAVKHAYFDARYAVMVSPNPARDFLNIRLTDSDEQVSYSLFNSKGQEVLKGIVKNAAPNLYVGSLSRGVYYLKVSSSTLNETHKIILE